MDAAYIGDVEQGILSGKIDQVRILQNFCALVEAGRRRVQWQNLHWFEVHRYHSGEFSGELKGF